MWVSVPRARQADGTAEPRLLLEELDQASQGHEGAVGPGAGLCLHLSRPLGTFVPPGKPWADDPQINALAEIWKEKRLWAVGVWKSQP